MEDIWQQFHQLPATLRNAVATDEALATVDRVEKSHPGLDLADFIMRLMVKKLAWADFPRALETEAQLTPEAVQDVIKSIIQPVFGAVKAYIGIPDLVPAEPPGKTIPIAPPSNLPIATPVPAGSPPLVPPLSAPPSIPPTAMPVPARPAMPAAIPPTPVPGIPPPTSPIGIQRPATTLAPAPSLAPEDDAEIDTQAARIKTMTSHAPVADALEEIAQRIVTQHNLAFPNEMEMKRALAIIKSRLKEIRNADQTRDMLTRPLKVGGLEMDPDLASNVVSSIEQEVKNLNALAAQRPKSDIPAPRIPAYMPVHPHPMADASPAPVTPLPVASPVSVAPLLPPTPVPPPPIPPVSPVATPIPAPMAAAPMRSVPVVAVNDAPLPPPSASMPPPPSPRPIPPVDHPSPPPIEPVLSVPAPEPPRPSPAPAIDPSYIPRQRQPEGPTISDITLPPSPAMGPVEEMRSLTLNQFRRLGQGANDAVLHLVRTFDQLKKESYSLWLDAVSAWRESELHRLYLDLGRQSMEEGISMTDVIKRRSDARMPYLSENEFSALVELNRHLQ